MPVPDGVVSHGEEIKAGVHPFDHPGLHLAEHAVARHHIGSGKIEIARSRIQVMDGQRLALLCLHGLFYVLFRRAEGAEQAEP